MTQISNQPPKGTYDWLPQEFAVRKYIFDTWRKVCVSFGYQEYLTPLVEYADIYRAKSGEDVGGAELTTFTDRGGRDLAIRPEMTPSVTRMVSKIYKTSIKPLRLFSIANFYRNEKPQKGRNREFWQLNYDIFGSNSNMADLETLQIALEIMLAFNPPDGSFILKLNDRRLIDQVTSKLRENQKVEVLRILDKSGKISSTELDQRLMGIGASQNQIDSLKKYISAKSLDDLEPSEAKEQIQKLVSNLEILGYGKWVKFSPQVLRGFDYYDGMVFEVFDNDRDNPRSLFGGGRYNNLANMFGASQFPAVGCAPGDETIKLFLENWDLIPKLVVVPTKVLVAIFSADFNLKSLSLSRSLRSSGINTELYPDPNVKLDKQFKYASDKGIPYVAVIGPEEAEKNLISLKNLSTRTQKICTLKECLAEIEPTSSF